MKSNNRLDIVFAIDDGYTNPLMVTAYSVLKNNTSFDEIYFHIISGDVSDKNQKKIRSLEHRASGVHVDFSMVDESLFRGFPLNIEHISSIAYARFLTADLFSELDKVLYLDSDILVLGDLSELWNIDISNMCIAGSHKQYINTQFPGYKESIGLKEDSIYINSGVMLMNLDRIRTLDMTQKLLVNARNLKDIVRIQDQDIINITFNNEIVSFDKKYNYTHSDRKENTINQDDVIIVHFNSSNKPWGSNFVTDDTNRVFAKKYLEYQDEIHDENHPTRISKI
jgi:lipopolysaccharide biosynthesis glycosyltransferase